MKWLPNCIGKLTHSSYVHFGFLKCKELFLSTVENVKYEQSGLEVLVCPNRILSKFMDNMPVIYD